MIDLILCVDNVKSFHEANLKHNPRDYSCIKWLGVSQIVRQQELFTGVYYNVDCEWGSEVLLDSSSPPCSESVLLRTYSRGKQRIKYGVISYKRLLEDLRTWDTLYVAGRLHKPVREGISWHSRGKTKSFTPAASGACAATCCE